jgi:hypothetical protein
MFLPASGSATKSAIKVGTKADFDLWFLLEAECCDSQFCDVSIDSVRHHDKSDFA